MWTSTKQMGILTCEEKITFDGASESWPVFCIEMAGIFIKHLILQLIYFASVGGSGVTPPHLYFQSACLRALINMAVNNSPLRWPMQEGNKDGVDFLSWLKVRYVSAAKFYPLRQLYGEKTSRLSLNPVG